MTGNRSFGLLLIKGFQRSNFIIKDNKKITDGGGKEHVE